MPSHEWDHLQLLPALQPASERKYRHGVVDVDELVTPPLPLSPPVDVDGGDLVGAFICLTLIGEVVTTGVLLINDKVSASASRHWLNRQIL